MRHSASLCKRGQEEVMFVSPWRTSAANVCVSIGLFHQSTNDMCLTMNDGKMISYVQLYGTLKSIVNIWIIVYEYAIKEQISYNMDISLISYFSVFTVV